jgi:hypothetical protein
MALLQKAYLGATPLFRNLVWYEMSARKFITIASGTCTANTAAHTKGAYQQLIASTGADATWLQIEFSGFNTATVNTASLVDIAIGASGSEVVIASNIAVGGAAGVIVNVPLQVPAASRLSARIQSVVTGGKTGAVVIRVIDAGDYADTPTSVDVIGTSTADSQGTSFSGASGTWVEGIASTAQAYRAVALVMSMHDNDIATISNSIAEIGVGAAGNEVSFANHRWTAGVNEFIATATPFMDPHGRAIPAGSRLAVKHAITANPSKYGFCLIGIP